MGQVSSWIAGETLAVLRGFVREHKLGWVFPANSRYQCVPNLCGKVRQPDVSFLRSARLPNGRLFDEDVPFAPDLAIEVISQRDFCEIFDLKIKTNVKSSVPRISGNGTLGSLSDRTTSRNRKTQFTMGSQMKRNFFHMMMDQISPRIGSP